ncbi:Crp/Fnr family transcriptional regulator [Sphingomonas sp. ID0503]|uniref:Crp/Fnr family transcriptional regulator n=1 Tax=Sphingomonas sp. ID0503 TaxID=3399691 RepID=UPI003AFB16B5
MTDQSATANHLLRSMEPDDFARLAPALTRRRFETGAMIFRADEEPAAVLFPVTCVGSLVAISPEGHRVESGIFGCDGFAPVGLVMGAPMSPYHCMIQIAGEGWSLPPTALSEAVAESGSLRDLLLRYAYALSIQTTYTALSNSVHPVDERLARWLLMCHDRVDGNELVLTHEFLSLCWRSGGRA